ncbi:MAG: hypothetical protein IPG93_10090 [Burkholderiales bacterium]|nr:hypothetical protein [Burkholderiales bacterium]
MTEQTNVTPANSELLHLLRHSDESDLSVLVDYLTDSGKGRISMSTETCSILVAAQAKGGRYSSKALSTMAAELSRFGGNSIINLFRGGEGVPYSEVLRDVLEHLKGSADTGESVESMELKVLQRMATDAWERMKPEDRATFQAGLGVASGITGPAALTAIQAAIKLGGFASYQVALQVANAMARALLGKGLTFAANAAVTRFVAVAAGPIGWVITALWTAYDLASPAYRVTVPCVVQIAYMRQKQSLNLCTNCETANPSGAKFCNNCGTALEARSK